MKAGFLSGPHEFRCEETARPEPSDGEAVVEVRACAFCGSDVHDASRPRREPRIPGHEFAGVVAEIRGETAGFEEGDEVVIDPIIRCGRCCYCKEGRDHLCAEMAVIGCQTPGGFAEYVKVPTENLREKAVEMSFEVATLGDPLAVALHGCDLAGDVADKSCMVFGAGTIGLLVIQVLERKGAAEIVVSEIAPSHLEVAARLATCTTVDASRDPDYESLAGKTFDVCVELAGGKAPTLDAAIRLARKGGSVLMIAQRPPTEISCPAVIFGEKRVQGVFGQTSRDFREALDLLAGSEVEGSSLITDVFPLAEIQKAYERVREPDSIKVVVTP